MTLSRRDFGRYLASAFPVSAALAKINSTFDGVSLGAQTYSFRDRSLDAAIDAMKEIRIGICELWQGHLEPKLNDDELRKWRETVSLDHFRDVRKKFDQAGIEIYAYNYSFRDDFTDAEIERGFEMAKALGITRLTASANVDMAKRIDPYAWKYKTYVGMHNHSKGRPNEFSSPEDFATAEKGMSKYIAVNLDIGHFWGAGYDPVEYLRKHHDRIVTLHIKDKVKATDQNMPFGKGNTPIRAVLQLLKTNHYPIPAMIEYEYKGGDTVVEVRKCFNYMKAALA